MHHAQAEKVIEEYHDEKNNDVVEPEMENDEEVDNHEVINETKEDVKSFDFVKGYNVANPKHPGKLIINEKHKYVYNKTCGDVLHYQTTKLMI